MLTICWRLADCLQQQCRRFQLITGCAENCSTQQQSIIVVVFCILPLCTLSVDKLHPQRESNWKAVSIENWTIPRVEHKRNKIMKFEGVNNFNINIARSSDCLKDYFQRESLVKSVGKCFFTHVYAWQRQAYWNRTNLSAARWVLKWLLKKPIRTLSLSTPVIQCLLLWNGVGWFPRF